MTLTDFIHTYFTGGLTDSVLLALLLVASVLLIAFRLEKEDSRKRSRILIGIFLLLIFTWTFVPASLLFCVALVKMYETVGDVAVRFVLGLGLLTGMIIAVPISILVAARAPQLLAARLEGELSEPDQQVEAILRRNSLELRLSGVKLRQLSTQSPLACTFGGPEGTIVVSEGLRKLLNPDEMEAVLVHELAHVRSQDSRVNILLSVYRKILFFDPILRVLESRLYREREFAADEFSAFFTRKPRSLASALLKVSTHQDSAIGNLAALSIVRVGWYRGRSQLRERVTRLIRIADLLESGGPTLAPTFSGPD